ncbi:hypothetical protein M2180_005355 [Bradyrhizobium japonicum]|nr:hypothetical protein [Bradyrhizobium japonicum]
MTTEPVWPCGDGQSTHGSARTPLRAPFSPTRTAVAGPPPPIRLSSRQGIYINRREVRKDRNQSLPRRKVPSAGLVPTVQRSSHYA